MQLMGHTYRAQRVGFSKAQLCSCRFWPTRCTARGLRVDSTPAICLEEPLAMDVLKRRLEAPSYYRLVAKVDGCCVAPLARFWTSAPAAVVRWDAAKGYPTPRPSGSKVVFAGSFNPPHQGHFEVIRFLCKAFKEVPLAIKIY